MDTFNKIKEDFNYIELPKASVEFIEKMDTYDEDELDRIINNSKYKSIFNNLMKLFNYIEDYNLSFDKKVIYLISILVDSRTHGAILMYIMYQDHTDDGMIDSDSFFDFIYTYGILTKSTITYMSQLIYNRKTDLKRMFIADWFRPSPDINIISK